MAPDGMVYFSDITFTHVSRAEKKPIELAAHAEDGHPPKKAATKKAAKKAPARKKRSKV